VCVPLAMNVVGDPVGDHQPFGAFVDELHCAFHLPVVERADQHLRHFDVAERQQVLSFGAGGPTLAELSDLDAARQDARY
jgi:hypothetical protein